MYYISCIMCIYIHMHIYIQLYIHVFAHIGCGYVEKLEGWKRGRLGFEENYRSNLSY